MADNEKLQNFASASRLVSFSLWSRCRQKGKQKKKGDKNVTTALLTASAQRSILITDVQCVTRTDHKVTQYVRGLAQFVLRDAAVQQDGLKQAGVV